ncbi:MAG: microviridin/marinostatin family tricyclic proteinase inhibitor [Chitinophagaceae bacterium]
MKQNSQVAQPFFTKFLVAQHESNTQNNTVTRPWIDGPMTNKAPSDGDDNPEDLYTTE